MAAIAMQAVAWSEGKDQSALGGISPKTKKRIENPRRFYGCELKPEYYRQARKNLQAAQQTRTRQKASALFSMEEQ